MIQVIVPGIPVTKGNHKAFPYRAKDGKIRVALTDARGKDLTAWQNKIADYIRPLIQQPIIGPVRLKLEFILGRPKTHFNKSGSKSTKYADEPTKKPDIDKLQRAVLDGLTGVLYGDDAQVVELHVRKRYNEPGESPGVKIEV